MSKAFKVSGRRSTFARGIHPPHGKSLAAEVPIEVLTTPGTVTLPLLQGVGAPARAVVKTRQNVAAGEMVADAASFVSARVHSPVAGIVQREQSVTLPNGRHVPAIPIKTEGDQPGGRALLETLYGGDWTLGEPLPAADDIVETVGAAGLVGMGGAGFPTHVKLTRNDQRPVDTLLVNGCECEPYLTADQRLMLEFAPAILAGARLAARACGADRIVVAVEDNKPEAIRKLAAAADGKLEVLPVNTKYPMGGERQLIPAALGREVPTGGLPLDVGVVVINTATSAAIAAAVLREQPLTHRVVSVTGPGIKRPANVLAPLGASFRELVDHCGGLRADTKRIIAGGPMMGFTLGSLDTPITKGASGLLALTADALTERNETACLRCGRCVDVCPLGLVPSKIALAARQEDWELARKYHMTACCECGCCAYSCPAHIPLVQLIRTGKTRLPRK